MSCPDDSHQQLSASIKRRWKRFVHIGILLFLISGFYNYSRMVPAHSGDGLYHALVGTKILLALGVFFLAAALVGRSEKLDGFRQNKKKWLTVMVLLTAVIVAISGYVKVVVCRRTRRRRQPNCNRNQQSRRYAIDF